MCGAESGGASSMGGALGGAASSTSTAATLTAGAWLDRQPGGRSQFNYASADERDRARSSWKPYPLLCARVAGARRADGEEGVNRRAAFEDVIERARESPGRNILISAGTHACSLGVAVATSGDSCTPWCASRVRPRDVVNDVN